MIDLWWMLWRLFQLCTAHISLYIYIGIVDKLITFRAQPQQAKQQTVRKISDSDCNDEFVCNSECLLWCCLSGALLACHRHAWLDLLKVWMIYSRLIHTPTKELEYIHVALIYNHYYFRLMRTQKSFQSM